MLALLLAKEESTTTRVPRLVQIMLAPFNITAMILNESKAQLIELARKYDELKMLEEARSNYGSSIISLEIRSLTKN